MARYKRDEIVRKLEGRGLRAKYHKCTGILSHFEVPFEGFPIGNKCRGYLDFLGVKVVCRNHHSIKDRMPAARANNGRSRAWSFAWFPNREAAESWVAEQKQNPRLGFLVEKAEVVQTEDKGYRASVQGGGA